MINVIKCENRFEQNIRNEIGQKWDIEETGEDRRMETIPVLEDI